MDIKQNSFFYKRLLIIFAVLAMILCVKRLEEYDTARRKALKEAALEKRYQHALELIDKGSLTEAYSELPLLYKDSYVLSRYVLALKSRKSGDEYYFYDVNYYLRDVPDNYHGPYAEEIRELRETALKDAKWSFMVHATPSPSPTPDWWPKTSKSSGKTYKYSDPYNAADYTDPEDFYDANYDAFEYFEDAEDYWWEYAG